MADWDTLWLAGVYNRPRVPARSQAGASASTVAVTSKAVTSPTSAAPALSPALVSGGGVDPGGSPAE